ncbi:PQQ-binding-like beta-propeller repeat protein, partial [bacterium]|nr:PQQ-binding-like beta-propeller repeat protein [bacterium]
TWAPVLQIADADKPEWPCFRGPGNLGLAGPGDWPTTWSLAEDRNIIWQTELPSEGKSSPVVWKNHIFLSAATGEEHRVLCYARDSGQLLWNSSLTLPAGEELEQVEDSGFGTGLASPTPVTDGKRVYVLFGTGWLAAFDLQGKQVWSLNLGLPESRFGYATSLQYYRGVLIVQYDQGETGDEGLSQLFGIDPAKGTYIYQMPRPVGSTWTSPSLVPANGRVELITSAPEWIIAYNPSTGQEFWRVEWVYADLAPSATWGNNILYLTGDGAELIAIQPGGSDNVTLDRVVWRAMDGLPDIASPVTDGEYLLQSAAGGYLTCYNATSGELLWEQYEETSASSSPILAGELVYLAGEDGVTRIFELADECTPRGKGSVDEPVYATPAFLNGRIYIRGKKHLFCIGQK